VKIALIVPGGVDRSGEYRVIPVLLWLIERLARHHEVHVFALHQEREPSRYDLLGATVHNIGERATERRTLTAVLGEHRRRAFDLFHAFWATPAGAAAAVLGKLTARPVLLHLAGGELIALPAIGYGGRCTLRGRTLVRLALWGASRITAASPALIAEGGALGVTVEQLVLGVDLKRWPICRPRPRARGSTARLLHVGSLNRVKDQGTLIRAAAHMRENGPRFHLDVVGEDALGGEVQRLAQSLGLNDVVSFHGFLPHRELRPLVEVSDLLVMSSLHEGGEVATLEAAAAGVAAVGTAVGHIGAWAPEAAVAVPVGDAPALAREVIALLQDDPRRMTMVREAQRQVMEHDADGTAVRIGRIYDELVCGT
jgi:glycosyltransferase involved in cell wall biosynthesis